MRLDDLAFEVLVQHVGAAHRPEAQRVVHARLAELAEVLARGTAAPDVTRLERGRVRRLAQQQRLDEAAVPQHVAHVAVVGLGIAARMARDLAAQGVVVVVERQVLAVAHHGAAALVGDDLQPVTRQFEAADDLGAQQAAHVRAVRVREVLVQAAADGRAADVGIALEHQHLEAGARQVARRHQPVVAGAHHDGVVLLAAHGSLSPRSSQAGTRRVLGSASRVRSIAISKPRSVSARQESSCAAHTNHGSRESGSHRTPSSCSTLAAAS